MFKSPHNQLTILAMLAFLVTGCAEAPPDAPSADGAFQALSFDQALARAGGANKVVMVDFYTEWCGPCKQLDLTTWKDDDVKHWLGEKTVAVKIDAERQRSLAGKYQIMAYPTMLFVKPDGSELGRLIGYKKAQEFLDQAGDILAGRSTGDQN